MALSRTSRWRRAGSAGKGSSEARWLKGRSRRSREGRGGKELRVCRALLLRSRWVSEGSAAQEKELRRLEERFRWVWQGRAGSVEMQHRRLLCRLRELVGGGVGR
jgi:hypothetical protein